ncbi:MAG: PD-(D/E)XK nuclease family protein [Bacteroidales bacterium]
MPSNRLTFLNRLSNNLKETYGNDLHDLAVIFPNRRAGLFFRKYLALGLSQAVWAPQIFSIEDLLLKISDKKIGENHKLLLILYQVYQTLEKEKARDFEDFLNWAPVLLDDFNEIDLYLADPAQVFNYLSEARAISQWSPDGTPLTEFQQSYLHFYRSLEKYYYGFHENLIAHHLATQGSVYRFVAENILQLLPEFHWKMVVFAGFNALSLSEEKILQQLLEKGKAQVYWDADEYYLNNPVQEAGKFLRRSRDKFNQGGMSWISNDYKLHPKTIHILGMPQHIGQAKVAGQLLSAIPGEDLPDTALVLADENMLIPVLNSIPSSIDSFNVTMGLPLKLTPVHGLFNALFQLHLKAFHLNNDKDVTSRSFYFRDLLSLFRHPWFSELLDANHANAGYENTDTGIGLKTRETTLLSRSFFKPSEVIGEIIKPSMLDPYPLDFLFGDFSENPMSLLHACQTLIAHLKNLLHSKNHNPSEIITNQRLNLEYLYSFNLLFNQIQQIWTESSIPVTFPSLYKLYRQSVNGVKLPFYGEPLKGLQVMGMLETRNLDFKNIIILHVNDDILPAGKSHNSFIPLDIKEHFHLPTYKDRQSVFAYHFYRLLQRAESVYLLYNTEPGQIAGGGKSRFIYQLQQELPLYNPNVTIKEEVLSFPPLQEKLIQPIIIKKDQNVSDIIRKKNESGWSASALNYYRNCKLKFYFKYVAGLEEPEEAGDSMDNATLGIAFHETLEELYKPFLGKKLSVEAYQQMINKLPSTIPPVFKKHIENGDIHYGKNFLLLNVAEKMIHKYLMKEKAEAHKLSSEKKEYTLHSLERWMSIITGGYKLTGIADRVDSIGNYYRILDYKSGSVSEKDLSLKDFGKLKEGKGMDKIFQLLFYSLLFYRSQKFPPMGITPCLVSLRRPDKANIPLVLPSDTELLPEGLLKIEELILNILDEISSPETDFTQTENPEDCKYCAYTSICIR